jgi:hypothetical protein
MAKLSTRVAPLITAVHSLVHNHLKYTGPCLASAQHVERGTLCTPQRINICLLFEGFPVWLLALDAIFVDQLWFLRSPTADALYGSLKYSGFSADLVWALSGYGPYQLTRV